jgi:hypothetical protein
MMRDRWDARRFPKADRANQFVVLASGFSVDVDALRIRTDARVVGATLLAGSELTYTIGNLRHAYLAPAQSVVTVNNQRLEVGDGIAASDETAVTIAAQTDTEIVLIVTNGCLNLKGKGRGTVHDQSASTFQSRSSSII